MVLFAGISVMAKERVAMRVVLRADAGRIQGTGHVMRCLTIASELRRRGHDVHLAVSVDVPWLVDVIDASGFVVHPADDDALDSEQLLSLEPDWVIVDSYRIDAGAITELARSVRVLAVIDGDDRSIGASLFLDQNLGAEDRDWPDAVRHRLLGGAHYALVRDEILLQRRPEPWVTRTAPVRVVVFMGGTDPSGVTVPVIRALAPLADRAQLDVIGPQAVLAAIATLGIPRDRLRMHEPTPELPSILGGADVVVSAAGTSAWDIASLGIPSALLAVVDNQRASLREVVSGGFALGLDVEDEGGDLSGLAGIVDRLATDTDLRERLGRQCLQVFDGLGKTRVAEALETALSLER